MTEYDPEHQDHDDPSGYEDPGHIGPGSSEHVDDPGTWDDDAPEPPTEADLPDDLVFPDDLIGTDTDPGPSAVSFEDDAEFDRWIADGDAPVSDDPAADTALRAGLSAPESADLPGVDELVDGALHRLGGN